MHIYIYIGPGNKISSQNMCVEYCNSEKRRTEKNSFVFQVRPCGIFNG